MHKKNLGKHRRKKQSLLPTESLGERKYASSLYEIYCGAPSKGNVIYNGKLRTQYSLIRDS